ncbi:hypothetical protein D917_01702, partial [Trichinella nativa]
LLGFLAKEEAQQVLPNEEESDPKVVERKLREIGDFFQGREEWLRYKSGRLFCLACRRCQSMAKVSKKWTRIGMPIEMYMKFMEHENSVVHKKSMDRLFDKGNCSSKFWQAIALSYHKAFVHRLDISPIFNDDSLEIAGKFLTFYHDNFVYVKVLFIYLFCISDAHPYSSLSKSINRKDCLPSDPEAVTSVSHESDDCKNSANFATESENDIINEEKIDKDKLDMEAGMEIDCMLTSTAELDFLQFEPFDQSLKEEDKMPYIALARKLISDLTEFSEEYNLKLSAIRDRCESFTCEDALELCRSLEEMDPS